MGHPPQNKDVYLTDTQLAFLETAMDHLREEDNLGHSTAARATEIKAAVEIELDERSPAKK